MNGELNNENGEENVFAISPEWFHSWQRFARGDTDGMHAQKLLNLNEAVHHMFKVVCLSTNYFVICFKRK